MKIYILIEHAPPYSSDVLAGLEMALAADILTADARLVLWEGGLQNLQDEKFAGMLNAYEITPLCVGVNKIQTTLSSVEWITPDVFSTLLHENAHILRY